MLFPCQQTPENPNTVVFHLGHAYLCLYQHECVVVCICELEHTYQCASRLREYWSLSRTHSTAAGDRATCIMPQSGLSMPAAHSHTHSCANLHWSDIWLHQQVGQSHFRHVLSALQRLHSLQNPSRRRSTRLMWRDLRLSATFSSQNCRAVTVARLTSAGLSRSLGCYTARAAGAVCCTRPGLDSHSPEAPSQLPSFTLSGILPATQEGPPNVYPRDSQQCLQLITATSPPHPLLPWGNTDSYLPKERRWSTVVKVLMKLSINLFMLPYRI